MYKRIADGSALTGHPDFMLVSPPAQLVEHNRSKKIFSSELRVRYVSFGDSRRYERAPYIEEIFENFDRFQYSEIDFSYLSRANSGFDALVVGGGDAARIAKLMRASLPALKQQAKIALLNDSNARRRALVLQSGFDEVIDICKTPPIEAISRIRAVWARYQLCLSQEKHKELSATRLSIFAEVQNLTKREHSLLSEMVSSKGHPVSYFKLRQIISYNHELITENNLKTAICKLRKKLRAGVRILSNYQGGYILHD